MAIKYTKSIFIPLLKRGLLALAQDCLNASMARAPVDIYMRGKCGSALPPAAHTVRDGLRSALVRAFYPSAPF